MTTLERVGVAPIIEKMVEARLTWFEHVERRPFNSVVRTVDQMEGTQITRGRGRHRKNIKNDVEINELEKDMVFGRTLASFDSCSRPR